MEFLQDNQVYFGKDPKSPSFMAVQWLAEEANERGFMPYNDSAKLLQRFAILAVDYALERPMKPDRSQSSLRIKAQEDFTYFTKVYTIGVKHVDECEWAGVICHNVTGVATELRFGNSFLAGSIGPEIRLLKELKILDLGQNMLRGRIPEELYDLVKLEELYLYQNQFTGTLSPRMNNWWNMTRFHASHNALTGSLAEALSAFKSGADVIRPIEYLNLYSNQLTGTIPRSLRFRMLTYLDLGRNQLNGTLPDDLGDTFVELRHLFLDHNQLSGTVPYSYMTVGNGRLESLSLDHNKLTGWVPDNYEYLNKMNQINLQGNLFEGIGKKICKMSVFEEGELVELTTDCGICDCYQLCASSCGEIVL